MASDLFKKLYKIFYVMKKRNEKGFSRPNEVRLNFMASDLFKII